jgi:cystathionine beta-lyase family protein involved in aluminum resistance
MNPSSIETLIEQAESDLAPYFKTLEQTAYTNMQRVLSAFTHHGLGEEHFYSVTGYAHNDLGREITDKIFAEAFQAEAALVRLQFVSGTHAIACALKGACALRQSPQLLSVLGKPYDTLEEVIGIRGNSHASLQAMGVQYAEINLLDKGVLRLLLSEEEQLKVKRATVIFIQRSRGYSLRPSLGLNDIKSLIEALKEINPTVRVVLDNCYGEFVATQEPCAVGADVIAGSLIKNPGGGLVPTGGYIAGKKELVEASADFLTAPGIGLEGGYTFDLTRVILQGLFFAPNTVKEALKGMRLAAALFSSMQFEVFPTLQTPQTDIIQVIALQDREKLIHFCKVIQAFSPVGAKLTPIPDMTPGYADEVIMAGGTFIFGSTIELSADAPIRPPYALFLQGGLNYLHAKIVLRQVLETLT